MSTHTLVTPSPGEMSLKMTVEDMVRDICQATNLNIRQLADNYPDNTFDQKIDFMFYRIIQEQVNNIIRHAMATKVIIQLSSLPKQILLHISDDRIGFDTFGVAGGIGLRNINSHAAFYDGSVQIISSPGKGCTLEVMIPLERR
jgi:signal transduction histidine kinase